MYTYILGKYYSPKKNREVEIFYGPFADSMRAESEALKSLVPLQGTYHLVESKYASRALARQEVMAANISGGDSIESALTRYRRNPETVEGEA